jgi:hypothetical protein
MKRLAALCVVLFACCSATSFGGFGSIDGKSADDWTKGRLSVVIAEFLGGELVDQADGRHRLEFRPVATLAGSFDATSEPTLVATGWVARNFTSVNPPLPARGQMVMAVIRTDQKIGDDSRPSNVLVPDRCRFMPGDSALVPITGLADPKVESTISAIRTARVGDLMNQGNPTTRPVAK